MERDGTSDGIIVSFVDKGVWLWCRDLGKIYCPLKTLNVDWSDLEVGQWVAFVPTDSKRAVEKAWLTVPKIPYESNWDSYFVLKDCIGLVGTVFEKESVSWCEHLGRVIIRRETNPWQNWLDLVPGVWAKMEVIYNENGHHKDIFWQAISISPLGSGHFPISSHKFSRASLLKTNPNGGCAFLLSEQYGKIFMSYMDYYIDCGLPSLFQADLMKEKDFSVFIVPEMENYAADTKWRAIYVKPWRLEEQSFQPNANPSAESSHITVVQDLQLQPQMLQSSISAANLPIVSLNVQPERFTVQDQISQTERSISLKLLTTVIKNKELLSLVKKNFRHRMKEIIEIINGRFKPNMDTIQCFFGETKHNKRTIQTQTAIVPEKQIAREITENEEIFEMLLDIDAQLVIDIV